MAEKHFFEQKEHAQSYLIPFLQKHLKNLKDLKILEIGCAEGGFVDALSDLGIHAVGLELEAYRAEIATEKNPKLDIRVADITDPSVVDQLKNSFDLVVVRDVIEHIDDKQSALLNMKKLLAKNGYLYITFPPKFSGFGGHQQNGRTLLRFIPYLHLLPAWVIRLLGKIFQEKPKLIEGIILNYHRGLSIRTFEKYCAMIRLKPIVKELFLIRPIYKIRFGLTPRRIANIPVIREFIASGCECLLQKQDNHE